MKSAPGPKGDATPKTRRPVGRTARWLARGLAWIAQRSFRRPWFALAIVALMCAVAFQLARGLSLDTNLANLLPDGMKSSADLVELEQRFGGIGFVGVLAKGSDPDGLRRFADDAAEALVALPSVRYVEHRRPVEFFEEKALFFLELADLEELNRRVLERYKYEKRSRNPLFISFEEEAPPSLDMSDLFANVGQRFGTAEGSDLAPREPYLLDDSESTVVVLAKPKGFSSDLAFARTVTTDVNNALDAMDLRAYGPDFSVMITGRYVKKIAQQTQITRDLGTASVVALAMVVVFLSLLFRRLTAVVFVLTPVLTGLLWTFGFLAVAFGQLNLLTGFVGAILMGIGIDYGIYLLRAFQTEVATGRDPLSAIEVTFSETGRAVLVAAFTTVSAFVGLGLSQFRAFHEFGVGAAVGTILVVTSYALLLPALISVLWRKNSEPVREPRAIDGWQRWAPAAVAMFVIVAGSLASQSDRLAFDYDFSSLDDTNLPEFETDRQVNDIIGYSQTPLVVLTDNATQQRSVVAQIRDRMDALGDASTIDFVASIADLVPDEQSDKHRVMERLSRTLSRIKPEWVSASDRASFDALNRAATGTPFGADDLPPALTRPFVGIESGGESGFVLVFPAISLSDGSRIVDFANEVSDVAADGGNTLSAAGEAMVLADVLSIVVDEFPRMMAIAGLLVVVGMRVILGSMRLAILGLAVPVVTLCTSAGVLGLAGLPLNYLNIMVIPVLFGLSIDGGIHLVLSREAGSSGARLAGELGPAVVGAVLTSGFGFGALLFAHHAGLNSVGRLMLVGLGVNLVVCLVGLLAWLEVVDHARRVVASADSTPHGWAVMVRSLGFLEDAMPVGSRLLASFLAFPVALWFEDVSVFLRVAAFFVAAQVVLWANRLSYFYGEGRPAPLANVLLAALVPALFLTPFVSLAGLAGAFAVVALVMGALERRR